MRKIILLFAFVHLLIAGFSQAGSLDPSFGTGGYTSTTFATGNVGQEYGRQVLIQSDGKFIVGFDLYSQFILARYNIDGSLDASFGTNGFSNPLSDIDAKKAVLQADGKIVLAGSVNREYNEFALVRYNGDGSLDQSFGAGGLITTNLGSSAEIGDVAVQPDGKIVAVGSVKSTIGGIGLARYQPDGSLDFSYGTNGIAITSGYADAQIRDIALQPDGKLVAAGSINSNGGLLLLRFNQDGTIDNSFRPTFPAAAGGVGFGTVYAVAIQQDGKIIAAGTTFRDRVSFSEYREDFAIFRFNANGSLDLTFGGEGFMITNFKVGADIPNTVLIQPDGKITVAGTYQNGIRPIGSGCCFTVTETGIALVRYQSDGSLDASFGNGGKVTADVGVANAAALQADGKIVTAGTFNTDYSLVRFNPDGSLDGSFDGDGRVTGSFYSGRPSAYTAVAVQPDGKIVVAGYDQTEIGGFRNRLAIARYNPDGSLDASFGTGGKITPVLKDQSYFNYEVFIRAEVDIVVQGDGKIVVVLDDLLIARFNSDGSPDVGFGMDGAVSSQFYLKRIALQPDGKIVGLGISTGFGSYSERDLSVVRYTAAGSLDPSFGNNGSALAGFSGVSDTGSAIAIQQDGKIVVAGSSRKITLANAKTDISIARFNPDGSLDGSFDGDGRVITPFGADVFVRSVVVQEDGKIVVGGYRYTAGGSDNDFVLVRYNTDGSLDASFDGDGKITTDFGMDDRLTSLNLQSDRKIVASGYARISGHSDFVLARYNMDGSLDASFGNGGKVITDLGSRSGILNDAAIANNRLYVVGTTVNPIQLATIAAFKLDIATGIVLITAPFTGDNASVCAGNEMSVAYQSNGVFNAGNVFTAYLFSALPGGDVNKFAIGTVTSTAAGSMKVIVPANTPAGPYTIQIFSSSPALQGTGASLTVNALPTPTITVSGSASPGGGSAPFSGGLTYQYYEGSWTQLPDFGGLKAVASGTVNNITLAPRKRDDQFAFLFQGKINIPKAGTYYLETSSDDGSRLYIGSWGHYVTPVVDNDGRHGLETKGGWYTFPSAGQYDFAVSYFEQAGDQELSVYWGSDDAGIAMHTPIPDQAFGSTPPPPATSTLTYQYYEGSWTQLPDFGGLKAVTSGAVNNITLAPRKRDDQFAFLFQGKINIPKAGTYYFETSSDDGSRLYIGGYGHYVTPVVNNDGQHGTETKGGWYTFPAAGQYDFAVSYFEQGGEQVLSVYWGSADAGIPMHTPIPDAAFGSTGTGSPAAGCGTYTLTASPADSYLWSTGETTRSIQVSGSGTFTVKVTSGGCSASANTQVVCEATLAPALTQTPSAAAVSSATAPASTLSLLASPNPSASQFSLRIAGLNKSSKATLIVSDVVGRVVEQRSLAADGQLTLGTNYRPGVYQVQLAQGNQRTTIKVVKAAN